MSELIDARVRAVYKIDGSPATDTPTQGPIFLRIPNLDPRGAIVRGILIGGAIGLGLGIGAGVLVGGVLGGVLGGIITVLGAIGGAIGGVLSWLGDLFD